MEILLRKMILSISLLALTLSAPLAQALSVQSRGPLLNDPDREQEFMDWGLGMFVHWSHDSQLGSVISHSMVGDSDDYLDRYINELPKTFNPRRYDPDEWLEIAKLAGVKYMVFTTKHHNGFCMWDTDTTDFSIMNTPYAKDIYYTQSNDGKAIYVFLNEFTAKKKWKRGERKEFLLQELKASADTKISVLGQNSRVLEYDNYADVESRFEQKDAGLAISVMGAQRIYNNNSWPNTMVVKLENVEFVNK